MANTQKETPNYGLPQWQGNELTDWYELNPAFETIDTALEENKTAAATAQGTADSNTGSIGNLTQSLNNTISRTTALESKATDIQQQVTLNTTHLNEHDTSIQALQTSVEALQNEGTEQGEDLTQLMADVAKNTQDIQTARQNILDNTDHIGNLSGLETTAKGNLVSAINEIVGGQGEGSASLADIGNLADLTTAAKENIVAAINDVNDKVGGSSGVVLKREELGYGDITLTDSVTYSIDILCHSSSAGVAFGSLQLLSRYSDIDLSKKFPELASYLEQGYEIAGSDGFYMEYDATPTTGATVQNVKDMKIRVQLIKTNTGISITAPDTAALLSQIGFVTAGGTTGYTHSTKQVNPTLQVDEKASITLIKK